MRETKESTFAFSESGKESFRERLASLIGSRSVRNAAIAWGLPPSTINNYLHKGTEPALKVVMAIAEAEKVSLEWLATGLNKTQGATSSPTSDNNDPLQFTWLMIYESLSRVEAESLIRLIHKVGAKGILTATSGEESIDGAFLLLPQEEKERLMALHEAKKGASEASDSNVTKKPASDHKQAS